MPFTLQSKKIYAVIHKHCIVASRSTCYYSENQKFCFLESRLVTCCIFFFRNKTFLFVKIESWNFQHLIDLGFRETSQNFSSFGQLLFFGAHVIIWVQTQLVTWGVTNQDVFLLATIWYMYFQLYKKQGWIKYGLFQVVNLKKSLFLYIYTRKRSGDKSEKRACS